MRVPPFANFLAVFDEDPRELDDLERIIGDANVFAAVERIAGWVVGLAPLDGTPIDSARRGEVLCAQGDVEEVFDGLSRAAVNDLHGLSRVAERARGDVCAVRLAESGGALLVRPAAGQVPLYVRTERRRTVISTRLEYCVRAARE